LIYAPPKAGSIRFSSKIMVARPPKIRLNLRNPQNSGPHPSTWGVAEQIEKGLMIYKTTPVMGSLHFYWRGPEMPKLLPSILGMPQAGRSNGAIRN
jgi:hypothetical protein